jgi:hypothetical protein
MTVHQGLVELAWIVLPTLVLQRLLPASVPDGHG